ncbi:MAG: MerR family transcriptional regulator [Acidobacteriota bacterium]
MAKKLFHKIGEACKILDIQPYVLRYWETEFPFLNPSKSKSGQRVYSKRELDIIRRIKELLYEEGYTIAGAKKKLEAEIAESPDGILPTPDSAEAPAAKKSAKETPLDTSSTETVETLRAGIKGALAQARDILRLLDPETT